MRYWLWLLGALSVSAMSAPIQKVLPLSVTIDKAQLYPYTLSLEMQPSSFTLLFDKTQHRFQSDDVAVVISTDIPNDESGVGFEYRLSLVSNESRCLRPYDSSVTQEGFISLKLDNAPFEVGDVLAGQTLSEFDGGSLGDARVLTLDSDVITDEALQCDGRVRLEAELAL
ncbi:hypothetical protein [Vibrio alginolyticus]|uniref:hypothetical protein n=1 Tax=Vibrio alginolyticus TaxID=663 RepID=UPI000722C3EB|nr:hypothetical protein [Vibrio alginolyticus]ALR95506.1 hypothetical protein AT730_24955 [Vibrio alginolyticus]ALR95814.1 hypothetical protein AT730_24695 [Vibrio alginolyticus]MBY7710590.1 hypothetical protein [Vibrio alginolyticus]